MRCANKQQVSNCIEEVCGLTKAATKFGEEFWNRLRSSKPLNNSANKLPPSSSLPSSNQPQNQSQNRRKKKARMQKVDASEFFSFDSNFEGREIERTE